MQIKLATARGLGYTGDAEGLRDPDTNLTYGVKYLAGAYRAANGDHDRAMHYYAAGYYDAAKRQRLGGARHERRQSGKPQPPLANAGENAPTRSAGSPLQLHRRARHPVQFPASALTRRTIGLH